MGCSSTRTSVPCSHHYITQLLLCCRRVINITKMDSHLVPDMLKRSVPSAGNIILNQLKFIAKVSLSLPGQEILPEHPPLNLLVRGGPQQWPTRACPRSERCPTPWWTTLHCHLFVAHKHRYISPSHLRTRIRSSLQYSLKRDQPQYIQWRRSLSRCHRAHATLLAALTMLSYDSRASGVPVGRITSS